MSESLQALIQTSDCLFSLYFRELHYRRDRVSDSQEGTNDWIWVHPVYNRWRETNGSILWIQGLPGTGKSTLAKLIQREIATQAGYAITVTDFFYSHRNGYITQSHHAMLRSLLHQLLQLNPGWFKYFRDHFRKLSKVANNRTGMSHEGENVPAECVNWPQETLVQIFQSLIEGNGSSRRTICCIVDGFDESDDDPYERMRMLNLLTETARASTSGEKTQLKLILVSRPEAWIETNLKHYYTIKLQDENAKDVTAVVDAGLKRVQQLIHTQNQDIATINDNEDMDEYEESDDDPRELASQFDIARNYLVSNARGCILWVTLVIAELRNLISTPYGTPKRYSLDDIGTTIVTLPSDYEKFYDRVIRKLRDRCTDEKYCEYLNRMFQWTAFARRSLGLREFRDAMAIPALTKHNGHPQPLKRIHAKLNALAKLIVDDSGCLVEVVQVNARLVSRSESSENLSHRASDTVQFIHHTVSELLGRPSAEPFRLNAHTGQTLVEKATFNYLLLSLSEHKYKETLGADWSPQHYLGFINHLKGLPLLHYVFQALPLQKQTTRELHDLLRNLALRPQECEWCFVEEWAAQIETINLMKRPQSTDGLPFRQRCLVTAIDNGSLDVVKLMLLVGRRSEISNESISSKESIYEPTTNNLVELTKSLDPSSEQIQNSNDCTMLILNVLSV